MPEHGVLSSLVAFEFSCSFHQVKGVVYLYACTLFFLLLSCETNAHGLKEES